MAVAAAAAGAAAACVLGALRSAPWCVDSSPSCCLMESRRPRHRKCLYCPPHSLPVAGMDTIGACHSPVRPGLRGCGTAGGAALTHGHGRLVPAPSSVRRLQSPAGLLQRSACHRVEAGRAGSVCVCAGLVRARGHRRVPGPSAGAGRGADPYGGELSPKRQRGCSPGGRPPLVREALVCTAGAWQLPRGLEDGR